MNNMRVLVTGSQGFAGRHLAVELRRAGAAMSAFDLAEPGKEPAESEYYRGDIRDRGQIDEAVRRLAPEACIHLGGLAFVPEGWKNAARLIEVNCGGTINLLEALRRHAPSAAILVVSSAEVYGHAAGPQPADESTPLLPANPYAVSKAAADNIAILYARQYSMRVMVARPSNHIGPGQSPGFAVPAFAAQLAAIAAGKAPPVVRVGNLECKRDFTDVRDVARAYRMLIERGRGGEVYNIASGREISLRFVLETLCAIFKVSPGIEIAPGLFRPPEARPAISTAKIAKEIGWKPEIDIMRTLRDVAAAQSA